MLSGGMEVTIRFCQKEYHVQLARSSVHMRREQEGLNRRDKARIKASLKEDKSSAHSWDHLDNVNKAFGMNITILLEFQDY
jgi:hypothetical protein